MKSRTTCTVRSVPGALPLAEAQQEIASNWYEVYQRLHAHSTNVRSKGEQ
jgi:hypothetical protein